MLSYYRDEHHRKAYQIHKPAYLSCLPDALCWGPVSAGPHGMTCFHLWAVRGDKLGRSWLRPAWLASPPKQLFSRPDIFVCYLLSSEGTLAFLLQSASCFSYCSLTCQRHKVVKELGRGHTTYSSCTRGMRALATIVRVRHLTVNNI